MSAEPSGPEPPAPEPAPPDTAERVEELARRREAALAMGGPERIARHHASGRRTARERVDALIDAGSWYELGLLAEPEHRREEPAPADAIVAGLARIDGRRVCVLAVDATVLAGTTGQVNMRKQNRRRRLRRAQGAAADLPQRQRRRAHPRRDGLALLGAALRLPHLRAGAPPGGPRSRAWRPCSARATATRRCTRPWATTS